MSAFTTIALGITSVAGPAVKGILANDASKEASRMAGRLGLEKERLEEESVAQLEQNFLDAVKVQSDVYDKAIQASTVAGSTIVEAAREGDQRGVSATAGKVSAVQDQTLTGLADNFAQQKTEIDLARAQAGERSASEIAALQDDRAAAAGVKADALTQQADDLKGQATGAFIDAGVSALNKTVTAFGGFGGGEKKNSPEDSAKSAADLAAKAMAGGIVLPDITESESSIKAEKAKNSMQEIMDIAGTFGVSNNEPSNSVADFIKSLGANIEDYTEDQLAIIEQKLNQ